jgi:hypothetical protein
MKGGKPKPLAASQRRPSTREAIGSEAHPDWRAQASGLLVETHLSTRRGPGILINQHQYWICNSWTHGTGPDVLENRCEPDTFMEEPLELLE